MLFGQRMDGILSFEVAREDERLRGNVRTNLEALELGRQNHGVRLVEALLRHHGQLVGQDWVGCLQRGQAGIREGGACGSIVAAGLR